MSSLFRFVNRYLTFLKTYLTANIAIAFLCRWIHFLYIILANVSFAASKRALRLYIFFFSVFLHSRGGNRMEISERFSAFWGSKLLLNKHYNFPKESEKGQRQLTLSPVFCTPRAGGSHRPLVQAVFVQGNGLGIKTLDRVLKDVFWFKQPLPLWLPSP